MKRLSKNHRYYYSVTSCPLALPGNNEFTRNSRKSQKLGKLWRFVVNCYRNRFNDETNILTIGCIFLNISLQDYLEDYRFSVGSDMKIIFFMDAIEHVCRLARILRSERGNGLLVGVGGMGKQSLTRLASHLNGYKFVSTLDTAAQIIS